MADSPPRSGPGDDAGGIAPEGGSATGAPRRVSVLGIIVAMVVVLVVVVLHLTGTLGPGAH